MNKKTFDLRYLSTICGVLALLFSSCSTVESPSPQISEARTLTPASASVIQSTASPTSFVAQTGLPPSPRPQRTSANILDEPSATPPVTPTRKAPMPLPGFIAVASRGQEEGINIIRSDGSLWKNFAKQQSSASFYYNPDWAPDGRWIVFSSDEIDTESEIYLADVFRGTIQQLTYGAGEKDWPTWSPDGHQIAYVRWGDQGMGLYIMGVNGQNTHLLPTTAESISNIAWSPDGTQIAFLSFDAKEKNADLRVIGVDGANERVITDFPIAWGRIDWSPDGNRIAFRSVSGCGDIYTIAVESAELEQITSFPGREAHPTWSPDGQSIAFNATDVTCEQMAGESVAMGWQIYIMDLTNGQTVQVTNNPNLYPLDPAWSPVPALKLGKPYLITLPGDYLNLRQSPSLTAEVIQQLREGDTVIVIEGPVVADDYYWWRLRTADGVEGWAVEVAGWYAPAETPTP